MRIMIRGSVPREVRDAINLLLGHRSFPEEVGRLIAYGLSRRHEFQQLPNGFTGCGECLFPFDSIIHLSEAEAIQLGQKLDDLNIPTVIPHG